MTALRHKRSGARRMPLVLLGLTAPLLGACASTSDEEVALPVEVSAHRPVPLSSYVGLVDVLDVVESVDGAAGRVKLRALSSDTLSDFDAERSEYVRVVLDVTTFAEDVEGAEALYHRIREALEAAEYEAGFDYERAKRVFRDMSWNETAATGLVSYSSSIRAEVRPGTGAEEVAPAAIEGGKASPVVRSEPGEYVRNIARHEAVAMGPVQTSVRLTAPYHDVQDVHYRIEPAHREAHYARGQIANFLYKLESDSPAVRVTRLEIVPATRFQTEEIGADRWTFEAQMTMRLSAR